MGVFQKLMWVFRCERCEHEWTPKRPWVEGEPLPTVCPTCKSPYWNKMRKSDVMKALLKPDVWVPLTSIENWAELYEHGKDPDDEPGESTMVYGRIGTQRVAVLHIEGDRVRVRTVEPTQKHPIETKWVAATDVELQK